MERNPMSAFLSAIEVDRDKAISKIQEDADEAIQKILSDAHSQSRQLQNQTNERLRNEMSLRKQKESSRVKSKIRRKRWNSLRQLQNDINQRVIEKMYTAWKEPDWQWSWCEFWLKAIPECNANTPMTVEVTEAVLPETIKKIEQWGIKNRLDVNLDKSLLEPGLKIKWSDFELDGLIGAQKRTIDTTVLCELTPYLPRLNQITTP